MDFSWDGICYVCSDELGCFFFERLFASIHSVSIWLWRQPLLPPSNYSSSRQKVGGQKGKKERDREEIEVLTKTPPTQLTSKLQPRSILLRPGLSQRLYFVGPRVARLRITDHVVLPIIHIKLNYHSLRWRKSWYKLVLSDKASELKAPWSLERVNSQHRKLGVPYKAET